MNILSRAVLSFILLLLAGGQRLSAQAIAHRPGSIAVARSVAASVSVRPLSVRERGGVGVWGAIGGALVGGAVGYSAGRSLCDGVPRGSCVRNNTIGGVVIGAAVGYGLERLFRWR